VGIFDDASDWFSNICSSSICCSPHADKLETSSTFRNGSLPSVVQADAISADRLPLDHPDRDTTQAQHILCGGYYSDKLLHPDHIPLTVWNDTSVWFEAYAPSWHVSGCLPSGHTTRALDVAATNSTVGGLHEPTSSWDLSNPTGATNAWSRDEVNSIFDFRDRADTQASSQDGLTAGYGFDGVAVQELELATDLQSSARINGHDYCGDILIRTLDDDTQSFMASAHIHTPAMSDSSLS
jgi:hypothetical protein